MDDDRDDGRYAFNPRVALVEYRREFADAGLWLRDRYHDGIVGLYLRPKPQAFGGRLAPVFAIYTVRAPVYDTPRWLLTAATGREFPVEFRMPVFYLFTMQEIREL